MRATIPSAAVDEHVREMWLEAVVGSRLDRDADALGVALLRVRHGLLDVVARVARESIVEIAHKVVAILGIEAHERASHDDELDLIDRMSEHTQLIDAIARL